MADPAVAATDHHSRVGHFIINPLLLLFACFSPPVAVTTIVVLEIFAE